MNESTPPPKQKRLYRTIPCKKCISFPVCISLFKKYVGEDPLDLKMSSSLFTFLMIISEKCSLFDHYTKSERFISFRPLQNMAYKYRDFNQVTKILNYLHDRAYNNGDNKEKKTL
jgi:hypothetical protein